MTPAELRAAARLGGRAAAGLVSRIEQVHHAVAGRAFGPGRQGPAGLVHDTIAKGVYAGVRGGGVAAAVIGGEILALFGGTGEQAGGAPRGSLALAALNAFAGDRLAGDLAPLVLRTSVRARGRDVGLTTGELAAAFGRATPKLAVFVHGLAETEHAWFLRGGEGRLTYGRRLRDEFGYTPVYVRYNTGRHVSHSGRELAGLLGELTAAWPAAVDELLLIGHSMGGLVIRGACHYGQQAAAPWTQRVRHVFYLGSPHLGAPLARAAGLAGSVLGRFAETRPFVTLVNGSSAGVKDLRHGYVLDDDWDGCDQDRCLSDHRGDTPLLASANHYAVGATITADPASPFGKVVGDLLVQPASAHGRRGRRQHIAFPLEARSGLGGLHHFDLLNHPAVWGVMRGALAAGAASAGSR